MFPRERPRRLRRTPGIRAMVRETHLQVEQLIYPLFIRPGSGIQQPIASMPGIFQWSVDRALEHAAIVRETGVQNFLFFGIPSRKDGQGSEAYDPEGIVQQALRAFRQHFPDAVLIADLCLCEYTDHGHCGVVDSQGRVLNDPTLDLLARTALVQAEAGADIVAPSDMMDGRVGRIRQALDQAGYEEIPVLSYAAKFASVFYGPFREAAENAPAFGDRRTYQMDPANRREAMKEVLTDIAEGADLVMVKPALPYLDIIREVRNQVLVPLVAYQVSGEFAMIKGAALNGWIDERRAVEETLTAIRRAGADLIITYYAPEVGRWLRQG